ncbi:MAG: hypothetical protein SOV71_03820 [Anaerovoracaceae bacterium]|nr:hypothetical protein [Bacillota bacterium]MDY2670666.1 hypothetical protein [Anaerovoracaceae bacterium]
MATRHEINIGDRTYEEYKADVIEQLKTYANFRDPDAEARAYLNSVGVDRMIREDYDSENSIVQAA